MNKKANLKANILQSAILGLVLLVVLFNIYATIVPEAQAGGDLLGDSARCGDSGGFFNSTQSQCLTNSSLEGTAITGGSIPLSGLFSGQGIVFLIIMASLIVLVVKGYLKSK